MLVVLSLCIGLSIFAIGIVGMCIIRRNVIILFLCLELMLLGINLDYIVFSIYLNDVIGQIVAIFVLTVAAAEAGIGLAILVVYYRLQGGLLLLSVPHLKG